MKTLKEIAAEKGMYQINDIPKRWRNESFEHRTTINKQEVPEFLTTLPNYEAGLFYECRTQDEGTEKQYHYIEHSYILVLKKGSNVVMLLRSDRHKKYWFHIEYSTLRNYNDISHYIKTDALKQIKEPNYIGVFTANKLEAWQQYLEKYLAIMNELKSSTDTKNKEIQNKIDTFIANFGRCEVSRYSNTTTVSNDLFRIVFKHDKQSAYLSEEIDFRGNLNDVININKNLTVKP